MKTSNYYNLKIVCLFFIILFSTYAFGHEHLVSLNKCKELAVKKT